MVCRVKVKHGKGPNWQNPYLNATPPRRASGAIGQSPIDLGHGQCQDGGPPASGQRLDERPLHLPDLPRGPRRDWRRRGLGVPRIPQVALRRQGHPRPEQLERLRLPADL